MNPQDKVQKILEWRECISRLPNDDFFNLINEIIYIKFSRFNYTCIITCGLIK